MSALDHLRALGRGETPLNDGLLGNARCGWGRGELIGEEAILAAFCTRPFRDAGAVAVETAQGAALIGEEDALLADIYNGRVGRLWRVGKGVALPHEPAIDLAFDPDMQQQRGGVLFRAEDHPELTSAGTAWVLDGAQARIDEVRRGGALRTRAFVVRAFATDHAAAALLAIHTMSNEKTRTAGFGYTILAAGSQDGGSRAVGDDTRPRAWRPRF